MDGEAATGGPAADAGGRDRALAATDVAFTISDPRRRDNPLVWVNPAFSRMTGYSPDEALGRNCRFLQAPGTDPEAVTALRSAIAGRRPVTVTLLNQRRDGSPFWNQLTVNPVSDEAGDLVSFVGIQTDVTNRVEADRQREEAFAAEQAARLATERARAQLAFLAEVTTGLISTLDLDESLERLADLTVPRVADWMLVHLAAEEVGGEARTHLRHRRGLHELIDRYVDLLPTGRFASAITERVRGGDGPIVRPQVCADDLRGTATPELIDIAEQLGVGSLMAVPLVARHQRVLGVMVLVAEPGGRTYDHEQLGVALEVGRRAGVILDNLRLYRQEQEAAEILQRSLLPVVPDVDGVVVATRYLPANAMAQVGGDFYEILEQEDGAIGMAVGDVIGHDLHAAAAMGHLRGLLRASAWDDAGDRSVASPARVLARVDRLMQELRAAPLATLLYARLVPTSDGWRLMLANAGHPAMMVRRPGGELTILDEPRDVLLGVSAEPRRDLVLDLPVGSTLVAFTDGLIERRHADLSDGYDRLAIILGGDVPDDLEVLLDRLIGTLADDREDDVAVVAVRLGTQRSAGADPRRAPGHPSAQH